MNGVFDTYNNVQECRGKVFQPTADLQMDAGTYRGTMRESPHAFDFEGRGDTHQHSGLFDCTSTPVAQSCGACAGGAGC